MHQKKQETNYINKINCKIHKIKMQQIFYIRKSQN